jgi:hypothetical protein
MRSFNLEERGWRWRDRADASSRDPATLQPRTRHAAAGMRSFSFGARGAAASGVHRVTHSDVSANSDKYLVELQPPSTTIVCPLMKLAPGEHRNATVLAMSSMVPRR